jgi:hypothetical protein
MLTSRKSTLLLGASGIALVACGSVDQEGHSYPPPPLACFDDLREDPLPPAALGAACSEAEGAPPGPAMAVVAARTLFGLRASGSSTLHQFFEDIEDPAFHNASGAVLMRGDFIVGAAVVFQTPKDGAKGEAKMDIAALRRDGTPLFTRRVESEYNGSSTDARLFGNDRGIFAYSYQSYPFVSGMEVVTASGKDLGFIDGLHPIADPDPSGYIAVIEAEGTDRRTYWLSPCDTGLRETEESLRDFRTSSVSMGSRLVFTDVDDNSLVVESATEVRRIPTGESTGLPSFDIVDAHPSGWVLVSTKEGAGFLAIHIDTTEVRPINIKIPDGLRRYDAFTAGPAPGHFDSNSRELRVTSSGGVVLPLRDNALAHLYLSSNGQDWQPLGAPIGNVYQSKGFEAGGSFVHAANAYAVSLPSWEPPPPGVERLDFQSTQLVRPSVPLSEIVEQNPNGSHPNNVYELSVDGGCLATSSISGGDIEWLNAVTGERFTFPMPEPDFTSVTFSWLTGPGVQGFSIF